MIRVHVKLYGTLTRPFQAYDPENGLTVELVEGASVGDLTAKLNIAPADTGVVAVDGRVAKPGDPLKEGVTIRIFQIAHGG